MAKAQFLTYKGRPIVYDNDAYMYGYPYNEYVVLITINSTKKIKFYDKDGNEKTTNVADSLYVCKMHPKGAPDTNMEHCNSFPEALALGDKILSGLGY